MKAPALMIALLLLSTGGVLAAGQGIVITSDEAGDFQYLDDFTTPRLFHDAFLDNVPLDAWQKGALVNCGPNRNRTLTYRFYGDRMIDSVDVQVEQSANGPNLGARNMLYLSLNGLDWTLVVSSDSQEADQNGWQREPLTIPPEQAPEFLGETEVWVRVVLDNYCGLKTNTSNEVRRLEVDLTVGEKPGPEADPQAAQRAAWGELRRATGWRSITLDYHDPIDQRAPHYYEDSDGWLQAPGANPHLAIEESEGFPMRRVHLGTTRSPLSLAAFVKVQRTAEPLMARIVVRGTRESSREMNVLWDGKVVATFDVASYFDVDKAFFVELPGRQRAGMHGLRIAGPDSGAILVRQITLAGMGEISWAEKPALPAGGSLEALSAYYMPDPEPPEASQAVEGRHKTQEAGLIIGGMQRLYREHADFGAVRVVVRNSSRVPVRISNLQLNGKPIEESYVDFVDSDWDAPGVVWYRIRPRRLAPDECGQIYIRFRHRPEGRQATVTVNLENGEPLEVNIPYRRPRVVIDYVTTNESMDTLYVYTRRHRGRPGKITGLTLDGQPMADVQIYGEEFPGGIALAVAKLPRTLKPYDYHVAGVTTNGRQAVATQFRVLPFFFPRSSIHVPPSLCEEMHMNLAMWHEKPLETCEQYDLYTTTCGVLDLHPRVAYAMGPDEPDAKDNRGGGYAEGLGWHARMLAHSGWQELIQRRAPHVATWIVMNGTVRPLNWAVYGQFADISCFDPYPVSFLGADHAYVRESLSLARQCGVPNRMYACLEAFFRNGRGNIPAEYRQNVVQAIGAGMKGLTSWVHTGSAGGWQGNEAVAQEIAKLNALIEYIEGDLLLGTPIDLATSDAGLVPTGVVGEERWPKERVWVGSLLCGPDTIVLTAVNHIPASKPDPPDIQPAQDVTITVNLPDFLPQVTGFEATEEGLTAFPCRVADGKAILKLDSIESGRVFVLRRH